MSQRFQKVFKINSDRNNVTDALLFLTYSFHFIGSLYQIEDYFNLKMADFLNMVNFRADKTPWSRITKKIFSGQSLFSARQTASLSFDTKSSSSHKDYVTCLLIRCCPVRHLPMWGSYRACCSLHEVCVKWKPSPSWNARQFKHKMHYNCILSQREPSDVCSPLMPSHYRLPKHFVCNQYWIRLYCPVLPAKNRKNINVSGWVGQFKYI